MRRDEAPIEQRADSRAKPALAQLREHERDIVVVFRDTAADPERLIERRADQSGNLGVVGEIESRIDVGFETNTQMPTDFLLQQLETREQLELLRTEHCGEGQGYLFSKARPADEVEAMLRQLGPADQRAIA